MWLVLASKKVGRVVGGTIRKNNLSCGWFCVFVGHTDWKIARFGNFVGHRSENDREKASVGRVVGSEVDRSEQKKAEYGEKSWS